MLPENPTRGKCVAKFEKIAQGLFFHFFAELSCSIRDFIIGEIRENFLFFFAERKGLTPRRYIYL